MKIVAFSDWGKKDPVFMEEVLKELDEEIDYLIYCGDNLDRFFENGKNRMEELAEYTKQNRALVVKGNDDRGSPEVFESDIVRDLERAPFSSGEIVFLGVGGASAGRNKVSENEIEDKLLDQLESIDFQKIVLVSHMPPFGVLDVAKKFEGSHIGSEGIRKFLKNHKVILSVCGHVHNLGVESKEIKDSKIINVASYEDKYSPNNFAVIDLETEKIDVSLQDTSSTECRKLSLMPQASPSNIRRFWDEGIKSLDDVKDENIENLASVVGAGKKQANLWIDSRKAIDEDELYLRKEKDFHPLSDGNLVFFDIETDLQQNVIWLIGAYSTSKHQYSSFADPDNERKVIKEFFDYLNKINASTAVFFGNNGFDERILKSAAEKYDFNSPQINFYDLGKYIQWNLVGGFQRMDLKNISESLGVYSYDEEDMSGIKAGMIFSRYKMEDNRQGLDKVKRYNKDDVLALRSVANKIKEKIN